MSYRFAEGLYSRSLNVSSEEGRAQIQSLYDTLHYQCGGVNSSENASFVIPDFFNQVKIWMIGRM